MKKIKVFDTIWHLAHQYELCKIPNTEWYMGLTHRRTFSDFPRGPMESYPFTEVPHYEAGKYDVAVLHLDQQCLDENLLKRGKGSVFRELNSVITDIPKIMIMHGTPYFPENFPCDITKDNYLERGYTKHQIGMSGVLIDKFKELTGNIDYFVFNSKTAMRQWGFEDRPNARAIWHGMNFDEWYDLPKEPRVITTISPGGLDKYYDRVFLKAVKEELEERNIFHCHVTVDMKPATTEKYKEFIGRSLIYFNPTRESCMPRARTEAMLSGCCMISTFNQDAEEFLVNGVNAIEAKRNPKYVADIIEALIHDYKKAIEIGQKGKETAMKLFTLERYYKEWAEVFEYLKINK